MIKYIIKRFLQMFVVLFVVSLVVFILTNYIGDPISMLLPEDASEEEIQLAIKRLGLDKPFHVQYGIFIKDILSGNFGKSYVFSRPALGLIVERIPATLEIVMTAMIMAIVLAIPLGVYAGAYPKRHSSKVIMAGSILGISLPSFWVGMMMIYVFSVMMGWMPASGRGEAIEVFGMRLSIFSVSGWRHIILPAFTLALSNIAMLLRLTRAGMQENMRLDYVKFARAKGVSSRKVLFGHALKNALIPVVTVFGVRIGRLIAFTTITETIYAWPGMGKLLIDSIYMADRPVIVAYLMMVAVMFVVINFAVDIIYTVIDPRIELR
ncbi:ABC transporter permease [Wukongibacter baidiensis]|uniref:ABC transporter permease n=1 Tax=Wukongibacter baidiensis TaxID=1723361 RepID=UPI003D7FDFCD